MSIDPGEMLVLGHVLVMSLLLLLRKELHWEVEALASSID